MSQMTMRRILSGSRPISFLMGRVWFNCNRFFNGFGFILSNPMRVRGGFRYCYSRIASILFYFILFWILI